MENQKNQIMEESIILKSHCLEYYNLFDLCIKKFPEDYFKKCEDNMIKLGECIHNYQLIEEKKNII